MNLSLTVDGQRCEPINVMWVGFHEHESVARNISLLGRVQSVRKAGKAGDDPQSEMVDQDGH
jgi:hypothetical protein